MVGMSQMGQTYSCLIGDVSFYDLPRKNRIMMYPLNQPPDSGTSSANNKQLFYHINKIYII